VGGEIARNRDAAAGECRADAGAAVMAKKVRKKKLTIFGDPEFIEQLIEQRPGLLEHYDLEIEEPSPTWPPGVKKQPTKGETTRAIVAFARRKMHQGMTAKKAARETAEFIRSRANVSKRLYKDRPAKGTRPGDKPGEGLYRAILNGLQNYIDKK
jgi:hypothetical protein